MEKQQDNIQHLPLKQRVTIEFKKKLRGLVKRNPHIYLNIPDTSISESAMEMLGKVGFVCHTATKAENADLAKSIGTWLKKGNLVLLRYRAKSSGTNIVGLLRALKEYTTQSTISGLIPIFIGAIDNEKEMEIFRVLGQFGIRYACFLSPKTLPENNAEEILNQLVEYSELLEKGFRTDEKTPADISLDEYGKTERYKELLARGKERMRAGKFTEAIELFTQAIELGPNTEILMARGDAFFRNKKYPSAINDYREANKLAQLAPDPHAMIGSCCFAVMKEAIADKDTEKAKKYFETGMKYLNEAIRLNESMQEEFGKQPEKLPKTPYASIVSALAEADFRGLGMEYAETKINAMVSRIFEETKSVNYLNAETDLFLRIDKGVLLARAKFYDEAEEIFRSIIKEDSSHAGPVYNNFAVELRKNGESGRAFEIYLDVLKYDVPDRAIIVENMRTAGMMFANEFRQNMKLDEAIAVYKKILQQNPKKREFILCEMAVTYLEMQDQAAASSRLMEAIYINPKLTESAEFQKYGDLANIAMEMIKKIQESFLGVKTR
ncbi:MAG: tetratricopeptide repeat protein [Nitrospinota bacterium]|nr:tetratricopeptide repeat protein [Nitrospinota bacterium]